MVTLNIDRRKQEEYDCTGQEASATWARQTGLVKEHQNK